MTEEENEIDVLTGDVSLTIYDGDDNPIRNAKVKLLKNNTLLFEELSDRLGECLIEDVTYDTYTLQVSHTGYETSTNTLTVDDETITDAITLTHLPMDPNIIEVDLDELYTFNITERLIPQYSMSTQISDWLQTNLAGLRDDQNHLIFGKVNKGFSEESLRTFGKKPVCDVYIDNFSYDSTFTNQRPNEAHTFILYYLKGANTQTYHKACLLHDYIMQELLTNEDWRRLDGKVRDTLLANSEIRIQPLNKKWGVIGAFELTHQLY